MKNLEKFGVRSSWFRSVSKADEIEAYQLAEELGLGPVWVRGRDGGDSFFDDLELGLAETSSVIFPLRILNTRRTRQRTSPVSAPAPMTNTQGGSCWISA